jgi:hypothetical protein
MDQEPTHNPSAKAIESGFAKSISSNDDPKQEIEKPGVKILTDEEQAILDRQLSVPQIKATYFMLYRYATKVDLLIIAICILCAMGAGAIFPLMTVRIPTRDSFILGLSHNSRLSSVNSHLLLRHSSHRTRTLLLSATRLATWRSTLCT